MIIEGIPDELLAKSVETHEIGLDWQPEYKRGYTGFAVSQKVKLC